MKSKVLQMTEKPVNRQSVRPLCTSPLRRSLFSLRRRVICISVSRFSSWELETPKEGHGHSGGATDTESQFLSHLVVFYCVGPSLRGFCTCCLICSAWLPIAACWPPALLRSHFLLESLTNTPLLHTGDHEQVVPLHSMHKVSKIYIPHPFSPFLVPSTGNNSLTKCSFWPRFFTLLQS